MLDDKIQSRVFPKSQDVQEPTGSPAGQENSEKRPDNMLKVITYTRNKSQDAEFDGAGDQEVDLDQDAEFDG